MLSKATAQLVEEVMGHFGDEDKKRAKKDPELCLVSMLLAIKKRLPEVSATLSMTIERAGYDSYLKEAREKIEKSR